MMISVKNLIKKFNKAKSNAVDDISFTVDEGSLFAFLGPNGAGKTTTISILTTTLAKTSGIVEIDGMNLEEKQSEIRKIIGIIFQKPSLDLNLTAEENIRFHASLYGQYSFRPTYKMMPVAYKDQVANLLNIVGLTEEDMNKKVDGFSGGMKRKLEIVRSLMHNPKILFLDEPTTGLDPVSRKNLWKYLNSMRQETGTTIFLTTHYLDEAESADKVVILKAGKVAFDGTPASLKDHLQGVADTIVRTGPSLEEAYVNLIES